MTEFNYVTPEIQAMIGVESDELIMSEEISQSEIRRFSQAIMDKDPLYWDPSYVKKTKIGSIVAPPLFPLTALRRPPDTDDPLIFLNDNPNSDGSVGVFGGDYGLPPLPFPKPLDRLLNGGNEIEFYKYAELGEVVKTKSHYVNIYQKQGKSGPLVFIVIETDFRNQDDQLLLINRQTLIRR